MTFSELKHVFSEQYAKAIPKWQKRNKYYYNDILRLLKFYVPEGSTILQTGIDDGRLLSELKPKMGVYVALNKELVEAGRARFPGVEFHEDTREDNLDFAGSFEYILAVNSIGCTADVQTYLERLLRFTSASTRLIITYYNYLWHPIIRLAEIFGLKQKQPIQHWLSPADVNNILALAGFEMVKEGRRMLCPKYIPLLSTLLNSVIARLPLINRLCFWNYVIVRPRQTGIVDASKSVSVIVPARNERGTIESVVQRIPEMGSWTEIIFVEWGSSDGTWEEIQRVYEAYRNTRRMKIFQFETSNKGDKVRKGFSEAEGDILMILDSDLAVPPEDLPRFFRVIASGLAEYAHGTRLVYPMEKEAMRVLNLSGNKFFSLAFSWLLKQPFKDTLCGTKVLTKEYYERLAANRKYFGNFDPFGDFDLIFGASKLGLKMMEVPVHYKDRVYGSTNIHRFRHGWLLLKMVVFAMRKFE